MSTRDPAPGSVPLGFVVRINYSLAKAHSRDSFSLQAPTARSKSIRLGEDARDLALQALWVPRRELLSSGLLPPAPSHELWAPGYKFYSPQPLVPVPGFKAVAAAGDWWLHGLASRVPRIAQHGLGPPSAKTTPTALLWPIEEAADCKS